MRKYPGPRRSGCSIDPLTPVRWRIRIQVIRGETLQTNVARPPNRFISENFLHELFLAQSAWRRRTAWSRRLRITPRRGQHFLGFGQIHRHARLTKNVFARFERAEIVHGRVEYGGVPIQNDVDWQRHQVRPVAHRGRLRQELGTEFLRAFVRRIRDRQRSRRPLPSSRPASAASERCCPPPRSQSEAFDSLFARLVCSRSSQYTGQDGFDQLQRLVFKIHLTQRARPTAAYASFSPRKQQVRRLAVPRGSRATRGSVIHRRGMAKKKGGVGRHVTKNVPRIFRTQPAFPPHLGA